MAQRWVSGEVRRSKEGTRGCEKVDSKLEMRRKEKRRERRRFYSVRRSQDECRGLSPTMVGRESVESYLQSWCWTYCRGAADPIGSLQLSACDCGSRSAISEYLVVSQPPIGPQRSRGHEHSAPRSMLICPSTLHILLVLLRLEADGVTKATEQFAMPLILVRYLDALFLPGMTRQKTCSLRT